MSQPTQPTGVTPADQFCRVLALFSGPLKQAEIVDAWSAAQNPASQTTTAVVFVLRSRCSARHHRGLRPFGPGQSRIFPSGLHRSSCFHLVTLATPRSHTNSDTQQSPATRVAQFGSTGAIPHFRGEPYTGSLYVAGSASVVCQSALRTVVSGRSGRALILGSVVSLGSTGLAFPRRFG